jgi:hypothetical protein
MHRFRDCRASTERIGSDEEATNGKGDGGLFLESRQQIVKKVLHLFFLILVRFLVLSWQRGRLPEA